MLQMVTLTGTVPGGAGGYARFEPSGWLTDTTDAELIPPRHQTVTLDAAGAFSLSLLATDNAPPLPAGWTWKVTIGVPGVAPYTFSFPLPYAGAPVVSGTATRDITDPAVAPVIPSAGMAAYLQKSGGAMTGPLTLAADPASALQAATKHYVDTGAVPQAQTFALANNTYKTLQSWTVTGQTGDPLPAFGLVAGSQTYGTSPAIQGPAAWYGYNAAHLSGSVPASPHGAAGISFFADAGDNSNGAGGHGVEVNPACFVTADGTKGTNALQMVAIDDNTNTVNMVIRCGTGNVNGRYSAITMQNADASKTYMSMGPNTSDAVAIYQPVSFTGATFTQSSASSITWNLATSAGTAALALTAAGTGNGSVLALNAGAGTASLILNGNNASTIHAALILQKSGVTKWTFEYLDPTYLYILAPAAPGGIFALWEPASTYATSLAIFFSQLQAYDSVICGAAALATSATTGFLYLPSCAGTPTGTPAAKTGTVPCLIDTTAGKLWANIGGAWKSVTFA